MLGLGLDIASRAVLGGAGTPAASYTPSLDFSDARNSQYTSVVGF